MLTAGFGKHEYAILWEADMNRTTFATYMVFIGIACMVLSGDAVLGSGPYNGPKGSEITIEDGEISLVDGPGDWIIWGIGQDVHVKLKNGEGSLTLKGFKNITIGEKNGPGKLVVEEDNQSVTIDKMDGPGHGYIRCKGKKKIGDKNGDGNVYFRGSPPIVTKKDGKGQVIREQ
jgi:hypothetical protein